MESQKEIVGLKLKRQIFLFKLPRRMGSTDCSRVVAEVVADSPPSVKEQCSLRTGLSGQDMTAVTPFPSTHTREYVCAYLSFSSH